MQDILIRVMEMPEIKNNHGIKAELRRIDGRLELGFMTGGYSCCEQWTYYPIHELPPHGDLVSLDDVKRIAWYMQIAADVKALHGAADNLPVIVPGEDEGEL